MNLGHEDTTIRSQNDSEYDSYQYRRWAQLYVNQITESESKKHFRVSKGRVRCEEKVSWIRNTSEQLLIITKSWAVEQVFIGHGELCKKLDQYSLCVCVCVCVFVRVCVCVYG